MCSYKAIYKYQCHYMEYLSYVYTAQYIVRFFSFLFNWSMFAVSHPELYVLLWHFG